MQVAHGARRPTAGTDAPDSPGIWYMAWQPERKGRSITRSLFSLSRAYQRANDRLHDIARAVHSRFGVYPQLVEPLRIFREWETNDPGPVPRRSASETAPVLEMVQRPDSAWPAGKGLLWHHERTKVAAARRLVDDRPGGHTAIRVGILDNGFDWRHLAYPKNTSYLGDPTRANTIGTLAPGGGHCSPADEVREPLRHPARDGHGSAPIGILAGRRVKLKDPVSGLVVDGPIGGIPDAQVVPHLVAPWVVSPSTANLALAIDNASRVEQCDVITMSHGGTASALLMDSINAAYERGTVIVAAAGNYFNLPFIQRGVGAPSHTVYPAGCRRVLGVSGVTAADTPYSRTHWPSFLGSGAFLKPGKLGFMRGSAGADGKAAAWLRLRWSSSAGDTEQARQLGELRRHQISAPSPNVLRVIQPDEKNGFRRDTLEFGGGTTSATPQVAAAAALWLAANRDSITKAGKWRDWRKAEAAIQALLASAERPWVADLSRRDVDHPPDPSGQLGAGIVDARRALGISYREVIRLHGSQLRFPSSSLGAPADEFAVHQGIFGTLFPDTANDAVLPDCFARLDLRPPPPGETEQAALERLHYNLALLNRWRLGQSPLTACGRRQWLRPRSWLRHPLTAFTRIFQPSESQLAATARRRAREDAAR